MKRIKPCENCKKRRRKCERPAGGNSCLRCIRLNWDCTDDTKSLKDTCNNANLSVEEMAEVDGSHELLGLTHHVKQLEREIQRLQLQLYQQRQELMTLNCASTMTYFSIPKEWNLTIMKGHLRLETGINSLSDLLQYRLLQSSTAEHIGYLSPFTNLTTLYFRLEQESMVIQAFQLMTKHDLFDRSFETLNDSSSNYYGGSDNETTRWIHEQHNFIDHHSISADSCLYTTQHPLILPATLFASKSHCPELMVDILVKQYFKCYNISLPLLHEPTFMAQYNKDTYHTHHFNINGLATSRLDDFIPSSTVNSFTSQHNPITLAICCYMSASCCRHLPLTLYQKREYGDYFYSLCREQIDELYDDPSPQKQLQVLIAINLLVKFIGLTLRLKDGRRLATIGYLISLELSKYASTPNTIFNTVERGLTTRHTIIAAMTFGLAEFICSQRLEQDIMPCKVQLDALPGESDAIVSVLQLFERIFDLALHHDFVLMVHQVQRTIIGQVGQVSLEALIRFDNLCMEWWKKLPDEWCYHETPYATSVKQVIEQCENEQALMVHSLLLVLTLSIHSSLLHPQNLQEHISELVQQRAMVMALNCCDLLMDIADRLKIVAKNCGFYCDHLLRVFDSLNSLMVYSRNSENKFNTNTVTKHFSRCLEKFVNVVIFDYYQSCPSSFPHDRLSLQSDHGSTRPSGYASHPLPCNALVFDIVSSSAKSLGMDFS